MNLRRCLLLLIGCLMFASGPLWSADIPRIIFDSDMSSDHDDAADIAVLHGLADLGECEIIACMASSQNGATAVAFNSINTYYGRPDIPCGRRPDCGGPGEYPGILMSEFPHPKYATYLDPPLCVNLYREVLAAQPDHSVSIVTTGYLNNLEALMKSGPDQYSPLSGMDLIRLKVKLLSCAGGCYPNGNEFNLKVEPAAAFYVINNWPTAAFFDGYDVGQSIYSGAGLEQTAKSNPIRRAFELTFFGPYPTWGQLMIYYAVRTGESQGLWDYNTTGHNNCDATGYNWWSTETDPSGAQEQGYMLEIERFPVQQAIETLVMNSGAPKSKGTVAPPNQPTNLRGTIVGGNRIDLQWTDNAWNETGFSIERKTNGVFAQIASVGAGVTSYSDTGLSSIANVSYRVRANNALGGSGYATVVVYTGWTEFNQSNPSDHSPIYHYYQNNLNWIRGPNVANHLAVNNDSTHGQDLTINVMVGAQGGYGKYYVYFFYQDQNNWYRLSSGSQNQGQANNVSKFEKCINGTITQIGAAGVGVNLANGSLMQNWQVTVSHTGTLTYSNNNNPTGNAVPTMHQVLTVSDTLSFSSGKIALGSDIGQPVWDNFSFDTASAGGSGGGTIVATSLTLTPATSVVNPNATVTLIATVSPANATSPTFAWYSTGSTSASGGTLINGQTASTYVPPTATSGTRFYYATVTAGGATVTSSSAAAVTVNATAVVPVITTQPASMTVTAGQTATFAVVASGTAPLSYQWKLGTTTVGTNNAVLTIANAQAANAGSYTCVVTNNVGLVASNPAVLTVSASTGTLDPLIPSAALISDGGGGYAGSGNTADKAFDGNTATYYDPADGGNAYTGIDVGVGRTATVTAIRYVARVGWLQRMIGGIFEGSNSPTSGYVTLATVVSASDTAFTTVTITGAAAYRYLRYRPPVGGWCNVAEIEFHGTSSASTPVAIAPVITAQPQNVSVAVGQTATFSVTVTGTPAPTFQWQKNNANISGATSAGYTTPATAIGDGGATFRCIVTNSAGSATSTDATLTVSNGGTGTGALTSTDIGSPTPAGSALANGTVITVKGSGTDIWGTGDSFQFDSLPLTGDGQITARVVSQTNSDPWAKAGVMIRESLTTGSRQAMTLMTPTNGIAFQRRLDANGGTSHTAGALVAAAYWVRLSRVGNTFTASQSKDGVTWQVVGSSTIAMGSTAFIGLAVTSHSNGVLSTAVFDSISNITAPASGG